MIDQRKDTKYFLSYHDDLKYFESQLFALEELGSENLRLLGPDIEYKEKLSTWRRKVRSKWLSDVFNKNSIIILNFDLNYCRNVYQNCINFDNFHDIPFILERNSPEVLAKPKGAARRKLKAKLVSVELVSLLAKSLQDYDHKRTKRLIFLLRNIYRKQLCFPKREQLRIWKTLRKNAYDLKQYIAKVISILIVKKRNCIKPKTFAKCVWNSNQTCFYN